MGEADSSKIESSSFSFLNFNWGETTNKEPKDLVYPNILDPNLKDYYLELSSSLESFISKTTPTFTYRLVDDSVVNIVVFSTGEKVLEISIVDFELIEFYCVADKKITIVLNRENFRRKNTSKANKEYKKRVLGGENIVCSENKYEEWMFKIFDTQIKHQHNFIFVDTPEDLIRDIKNLVKSLKTENVFVPKIKSYKPEKKIEHFEEILLKIPGIGKCAAKTISTKFKTLPTFYTTLLRGGLENLVIWDEENGKGRPLGKHQSEKLKRAFLTEDSSVLLQEF
ncbi:hypothetical protein NGRA_0198 [Nosema granulosis]|uniref:Uncharacterized protein n=1 Tax=Nosema granulosis TaxID=83296 RepID=A0A9P6H0V1_9MICR|nr:hypothetical protein NGRA_0198 [Nosema granulosis]